MHRPTEQQSADFAMRFIALLYLVMLATPIPLFGRAFMHDLLAPLMLVLLIWQGRHQVHAALRAFSPLVLYLVLALAATLCHFSLRNSFEWAIFAYLAIVFAFFTQLRVTRHECFICGLVMLVVIFGALFLEYTNILPVFHFTQGPMYKEGLSFLHRRFQFTLDNPNLFAPFYAIPCLLLTRVIHAQNWQDVALKKRLLVLAAIPVLLIPLILSGSKHSVLSLALLLSWMPCLFPKHTRLLRAAACIALLGAIFICETTVLFATFPLKTHAPFINTVPGMYTIHQRAYAAMFLSEPRAWLTGMGEQRTHELYSVGVDRDQALETLAQYHWEEHIDVFTGFMDPHNEYLNQLVLFGAPALLALLVAIASCASIVRRQNPPMAFTACLFLLALLASCLWDDIMSKRYVWLVAALCLPPLYQKPSAEPSIEMP